MISWVVCIIIGFIGGYLIGGVRGFANGLKEADKIITETLPWDRLRLEPEQEDGNGPV